VDLINLLIFNIYLQNCKGVPTKLSMFMSILCYFKKCENAQILLLTSSQMDRWDLDIFQIPEKMKLNLNYL